MFENAALYGTNGENAIVKNFHAIIQDICSFEEPENIPTTN